MLFYSKSGHVQSTDEKGNPGREVMVFRHMPGSAKKRALAPYIRKAPAEEEQEGGSTDI